MLAKYCRLTPTHNRSNDYFGLGDFPEDKDQLVEHEGSLSTHPHDSSQGEVVDQEGHHHTTSIHCSLLNASYKHQQHAEYSYGELDVVLGVVTISQFSKIY